MGSNVVCFPTFLKKKVIYIYIYILGYAEEIKSYLQQREGWVNDERIFVGWTIPLSCHSYIMSHHWMWIMNFLIYVLYNCVQKMNSTDSVYAQTHILSITTHRPVSEWWRRWSSAITLGIFCHSAHLHNGEKHN